MARHNSNHKGKAQDCYLCIAESEIDKMAKVRKRRKHGWTTRERGKVPKRTS